MRKYSKLAIVFSHTSPDETEAGTIVQLTNGTDTVELPDFEAALRLLPKGSEVVVLARGTVGNKTVHYISRIISENNVFVSLDLSEVTECTRVHDSPFEGNKQLVALRFPSNLATINPRAFAGCAALESLSIPETCRKIGEQAFAGCKRLRRIEFKSSAGWMANGAPADLTNPFENPRLFVHPRSAYYSQILEK